MSRAASALAISVAIAVGLAPSLPARAAQNAVAFAPHRAVYEVTLARATPSAGITELTGRMVYEFTGNACEGYEQRFRYVTVSTDHDGAAQTGDLRSSMWEDAAGEHFRFSTSQYQNHELANAAEGDARRKTSAGRVDVQLSKPSARALSFPVKVFFPMQHSLALAKAASSGESFFAADLYDGSEKGDKTSHVAAVIGSRSAPGARAAPPSLRAASELLSAPSWPVSIGFFDMGSERRDATPTAEQSYRFYANGVATDLVSDFGEYALKFDITELTVLDSGACPASKSDANQK